MKPRKNFTTNEWLVAVSNSKKGIEYFFLGRLNQILKEVFILIYQRIIQLIEIHPFGKFLKICFCFYFDTNQCGTSFLIIFLNELKPHNVVVGSKNVIYKFLQRAGPLSKTD